VQISVDQDRCVSSGQCVRHASAVFDQRDDDGVVILLNDDPPADLADEVRSAATDCPAQAITIKE